MRISDIVASGQVRISKENDILYCTVMQKTTMTLTKLLTDELYPGIRGWEVFSRVMMRRAGKIKIKKTFCVTFIFLQIFVMKPYLLFLIKFNK